MHLLAGGEEDGVFVVIRATEAQQVTGSATEWGMEWVTVTHPQVLARDTTRDRPSVSPAFTSHTCT